MPRKIDWDNFETGKATSGGAGGGRQFIKFGNNTTVRVRPIGTGIEFAKLFNRSTKKSINVEVDDAQAVSKYVEEKTGVEINPSHRFAINVIDRADGEIKILEGSYSIFKYFGAWAKEMHREKHEKISVGHGKYGGNWTIASSGDGKARRYTTTFTGTAPITKEESEKINQLKDTLNLNEQYKVCPKDKVLEWLMGVSPEDSADTSEPNDFDDQHAPDADDVTSKEEDYAF